MATTAIDSLRGILNGFRDLNSKGIYPMNATETDLLRQILLEVEIIDLTAIDLTAPPTNIGTTTPPAITVSTLFRSANTGNVPFIANPSGSGAFQLQQTDSTTTGGNARGANAVDLQLSRVVATQVASGINSFAAGYRNVASGAGSTTLGAENTASGSFSSAIGRSNTASGTNSLAAGRNCISSGGSSIVLGEDGNSKSLESLLVLSSNIFGNGKTQLNQLVLGVVTTDATPAVLRSSTSAAGSSNQLVLQNNSSIAFTAIVTATTTAAGDCSSWKFEGQIQRGANAASTALVAAITPALIAQKAGASGWAVAVTANTTLGGLTVTVTGQAATTIRWTCTLFASEVAF